MASLVGAVVGAILTDRCGRRKQLISATVVIIILFVVIIPLNATNLVRAADGSLHAKNAVQARAIIALICLFAIVFSVGYTPLQLLYPAEVLRYETRAKGMGMLNFFVSIATFYDTFVTGIAFTNIGWRYYFVFIIWNILAIAIIWRFFVETLGRTVEELTEIFRAQFPVTTSLTKSEIVILADEILVYSDDKMMH